MVLQSTTPSIDNDCLLTERQAAEFLAITPRALQMWRFRGEGPQFVKMGSRSVRYRKHDLVGWVDGQLRNSTSEGKQ